MINIKENIQSIMAVACFIAGTAIAIGCIFFVEPIGEIHTTAISIVSEFLILCGGLLGLKSHFDQKFKTFETQYNGKKTDE